ncbi:hypothetical protein DAEQUDRAFT_722528 [Daedalea quercina L-15889]|uniref:BTB domain-containing protein n=1 Tax=Daedalea quercina L-15889 TaxID=1314783 RepID=A0A165T3X2_9APHY|nr:hypothetical protein DAEQUDRAFT_722528 [Daedalea quercina L-15889]
MSTHGGYLTAQQESASLDLSFSFTLDNLRSLFVPPVPAARPPPPGPEDDGEPEEPYEEEPYEEPVDVYAEPRTTGVLWPGLVLRISRASEGSSSRQRKARLSVHDADPGGCSPLLATPGLQVAASVHSLGGHTYTTRALRKERAEGGGGRAVAYAGTILAQRTFEATERMVAENAVVVRVSVKAGGAALSPSVSRSSSAREREKEREKEESASVKPSPGARPTLELIHRVLTARPVGRTRFIVFRRRSSEGRVTCPRVFYANMEELAMWYERCESLLDVETHLEGFELPNGERLDKYNLTSEDSEPDSDFDPDEDEEDEDGDLVVVKSESQKHGYQYPPASLAADMARASIRDEDKELDDEDPMLASTMSFEMVQNRREEGFELYGENAFDGTTIVLLGAAARTWEALLYYLYTGIIDFAPLKPQRVAPRHAALSHQPLGNGTVVQEANRPPPASCRSIYRLAHKLSLDGLRKLALHHLESQLTPETVLTEVFSPFTAQYPEIKQLTLRSVVRYWDTLAASAAFRSKMVEVTSGRVPHAADVISEIMVRVSAARA